MLSNKFWLPKIDMTLNLIGQVEFEYFLDNMENFDILKQNMNTFLWWISLCYNFLDVLNVIKTLSHFLGIPKIKFIIFHNLKHFFRFSQAKQSMNV